MKKYIDKFIKKLNNYKSERFWIDEEYDYYQMEVVSYGRNETNNKYGNINDLDPKLYGSHKMELVSLGRGTDKELGNIDDLNPNLYYYDQMLYTSKGRGSDSKYGNIDDLNPKLYDTWQMRYVSLGRGSDISYNKVCHINPNLYDFRVFKNISKKGYFDAKQFKDDYSGEPFEKTMQTIKENNPEWLKNKRYSKR